MTKGRQQLVLVEDNPGDALLLKVMVESTFRSDVDLHQFGDLHTATDYLRDHPRSLVLLDLTLPDSWGPDTFRTLRKTVPSNPVVILSGMADEALALELVREGAQDYLVKGQFDQNLLSRVIGYAWERSAIEQELVERRVWWESVLQAIPDAVLVSDARHRILFVNRAAESLWDQSTDKLLHCYLEKLLPPANSALTITQSSGRGVPVEIHSTPFRVARQALDVTIVRDISERRALEQQLLQTQKMDALGHLTAGIAHDFNNLLGVIVGNLDLLKLQAHDDPKFLRRVDQALDASRRGADLTRRLLTFSRRQDLRPKPIDICRLIQGFAEMATRTVGPEIEIRLRIADDLPWAFADQSGLENVLLNLVINAKDAMPRGGKIWIEADHVHVGEEDILTQRGATHPGDYLCLSVTDTGFGMPDDVIDRIFEPFFTTKEPGKGTGLGLSMVYGFVKQSGGWISVYSMENEGTTFRLYLPLANVKDDHSDEPKEMELPMAHGALALVVDDERQLREVAQEYLVQLDYRVLWAANGQEAYELLAATPEVQLLLTDLMMPGGMSGVDLARQARELRPSLKVILMSGFPAGSLTGQGLTDALPLLTKPFLFRDLVRLLRP